MSTSASSAAKRPILTFVTGNANKLREVRAILSSSPSFPFDVVNVDLDTPEVQGSTQDVAKAKCRAAAKAIDGPVITEDTALEFDALGGLPGPYIKDFLAKLGHDGLNTMLSGFPTTAGAALCTFAFCPSAASEPILFEGRTRGRIVPARGPNKFGWDPIFEVEGTGRTYAEMDGEEKNKLSHRYKALKLLQDYLCALPTGAPAAAAAAAAADAPAPSA